MKKINLGIIGMSSNNGHPYSFSSIINGYNRSAYLRTQWGGILGYLEKRDSSEFNSLNAEVTHVWTQDYLLSKEIAECSNIENIVDSPLNMIGFVDGVIIARDDYQTHLQLSLPFLENNIPVFIDKPLTVSKKELELYKGYYDKGLIMSCSGLRFCKELDYPRKNLEKYGDVKLVRSAVINSWEKYGIHMIDTTLGIWDIDVSSVSYCKHPNHETFILNFVNDMIVQIDTLGPHVKAFSYEIFGSSKVEHYEIRDNFSAFKRTLENFLTQIETGIPALSWDSINRSISILVAGIEAKRHGSTIKVCYE